MKRWIQGLCIALGSVIVTVAVLAAALAWGPHYCKPAFPMVIGCALGSYESLAAGIIASAAALIAGWLAWSAIQAQIEAEAKRAVADRVEVEEILKQDIDTFADGLAAIWRILDSFDEDEAEFYSVATWVCGYPAAERSPAATVGPQRGIAGGIRQIWRKTPAVSMERSGASLPWAAERRPLFL
jgi:hypothetical protein